MKYEDGALIGQVAMDLISLLEEASDEQMDLAAVQITLILSSPSGPKVFTTLKEVDPEDDE